MANKPLKQKVKKKKWFPLYAPGVFNNQLIGESFVESSESLKGKFINANLSTITNDMKKQNISVTLRVNRVIEGKGYTEIIGMRLLQTYLKRLVRRGRTKVDDSFTVRAQKNVLVRVKPLIITNSNCTRAAATELRRVAKEFLKERVAAQTVVKTVEDILTFRLQKDLKERLGKLLPVRSVDIRVFERELVRGKVPEDELDEDEENPVEEAASTEEKSKEGSPEEVGASKEPAEEGVADEEKKSSDA